MSLVADRRRPRVRQTLARRSPAAFWCTATAAQLADAFALDDPPPATPAHITPGETALVLTDTGNAPARWGVPRRRRGKRRLALRVEHLHHHPDDLDRHRVAIPATSWLAGPGRYAAMHRCRLFAFAALAQPPEDDTAPMSFAILTVPGNRRFARLPVVLSPALAQRWVHAPTQDARQLVEHQAAGLQPRLVTYDDRFTPRPDATSARRLRSNSTS